MNAKDRLRRTFGLQPTEEDPLPWAAEHRDDVERILRAMYDAVARGVTDVNDLRRSTPYRDLESDAERFNTSYLPAFRAGCLEHDVPVSFHGGVDVDTETALEADFVKFDQHGYAHPTGPLREAVIGLTDEPPQRSNTATFEDRVSVGVTVYTALSDGGQPSAGPLHVDELDARYGRLAGTWMDEASWQHVRDDVLPALPGYEASEEYHIVHEDAAEREAEADAEAPA